MHSSACPLNSAVLLASMAPLPLTSEDVSMTPLPLRSTHSASEPAYLVMEADTPVQVPRLTTKALPFASTAVSTGLLHESRGGRTEGTEPSQLRVSTES